MKEPSFFCSDFNVPDSIQSIDDYLALFARAPARAIVGEASTVYLLSEVAIPKIMALNPRAKIIVMLRHPIEAARSLHMHNLDIWTEDIKDFEEAWRAQPERAQGRRLPSKPHMRKLFQYGSVYT